jgi:DHA1 family solute carrier family 18 vesicular amine transporter 1/2
VKRVSLRSSRTVALSLVTFAAFTDIVAYSVAVPVLPDLGRRLGASPTIIGVLFASFGATLLAVSMPMGAASDRIGRRLPLVGGLLALTGASLLFAFANRLPWLFVARLVQGAADAVTWVVGFALIADLYGPEERGRVMGIVMSGTGFAMMAGPSLGGWLYEVGGIRLPFLMVSLLAAIGAIAFMWLELPARHAEREAVPVLTVLRVPAIASCAAAVVAASASISMLEPVLSLFMSARLGIGPARIGLVFGAGAVVSSALHPIYGRLTDRWGGRPLTIAGLVLAGSVLPLLGRAWSFESTIALYVLEGAMVALIITPSLAYMAQATSDAGIGSFGVSYGLYNVAWGVGVLTGPSLGGFLFDRIGLPRLTLVWAPAIVSVALSLAVATRFEPAVQQCKMVSPPKEA